MKSNKWLVGIAFVIVSVLGVSCGDNSSDGPETCNPETYKGVCRTNDNGAPVATYCSEGENVVLEQICDSANSCFETDGIASCHDTCDEGSEPTRVVCSDETHAIQDVCKKAADGNFYWIRESVECSDACASGKCYAVGDECGDGIWQGNVSHCFQGYLYSCAHSIDDKLTIIKQNCANNQACITDSAYSFCRDECELNSDGSSKEMTMCLFYDTKIDMVCTKTGDKAYPMASSNTVKITQVSSLCVDGDFIDNPPQRTSCDDKFDAYCVLNARVYCEYESTKVTSCKDYERCSELDNNVYCALPCSTEDEVVTDYNNTLSGDSKCGKYKCTKDSKGNLFYDLVEVLELDACSSN